MQKFLKLDYPNKFKGLIFLVIATVICLMNVHGIQQSGERPYLFLYWDIFLGWVPVLLAIVLDAVYLVSIKLVRIILVCIVSIIWLLFFPNSPYLVTELLHIFIHYSYDPTQRFWVDMEFWQHLFTLFLVALVGLLLTWYSLNSIQMLIRKSYGIIVGWFAAMAILVLSSFGVYIGRFVRWNSWDVLTRPGQILQETYMMLTDSTQFNHIFVFCKFMFMIMVISYLPMYWIANKGQSKT
ncbi:DUF1361 domain-containing protein [Paenibacillus sambharensis]|uniref:DUF1361 domain-containing protein n=1 Tax=Paenibacillus sambharensis TaxID=1803190 RepID=A0A2W1LAI4_9BACL|nr:DUF1361 domain-containing protein [Paenibacillus sambharensis]PZD97258.1 DUF1361 domain-containing protein [Paenibacillus sambharensis]